MGNNDDDDGDESSQNRTPSYSSAFKTQEFILWCVLWLECGDDVDKEEWEKEEMNTWQNKTALTLS